MEKVVEFDSNYYRDANDSRQSNNFLMLHRNFLTYFSEKEVSRKDSRTNQTIYICELINTEYIIRSSNQLDSKKRFWFVKKVMVKRYGISEPTLKRYENNFVKLGLINISRSNVPGENRNLYLLNHKLIHDILTKKLDEIFNQEELTRNDEEEFVDTFQNYNIVD